MAVSTSTGQIQQALLQDYCKRFGFDALKCEEISITGPGQHFYARIGNTEYYCFVPQGQPQIPALEDLSRKADHTSPDTMDIRMNSVEGMADVHQLDRRHRERIGHQPTRIYMTPEQRNTLMAELPNYSALDTIFGMYIKVLPRG